VHGKIGSELLLRVDIPALTGLRFVAAVMVLVGHGVVLLQFGDFSLPVTILNPLGPIGMTLFFVLSGFVMWINYAESFRNGNLKAALWKFAVARFARIYPLYLCVAVLGIAITPWTDVAPSLRWKSLAHLMLIQAWIPNDASSINMWNIGHAWSISVEMFLYACFPVICAGLFLVRRRRMFVWLGAAGALLLGLATYFYLGYVWEITAFFSPLSAGDVNRWIGYHSPVTRIFEFFVGCCAGAAFMAPGSPRRPSPMISWVAIAGLAASAALFAASSYAGPWYRFATSAVRVLPILSTAALLFSVATMETAVSRFLSRPLVVAGGETSYSMYLIHPFLLPLFTHPVVPKVNAASLFGWFALLTVAIGSVVVFSRGSYSVIEMPARRWLRKIMIAQLDSPLKLVVPAERPGNAFGGVAVVPCVEAIIAVEALSTG
jgi:peptidoglycan/LPS O-acetylase OafA/YrhL